MKKTWLVMAVLTMALGATACSSNNSGETAATTTAESTEAVTEATESVEETEEEEVEEESMTGVITAVNGEILTVLSDDDDSEKDYDLSKAEIVQEFPFAEGDLVEIIFPYETTEDPVPVISLEVLESVIAQSSDPTATGTVTEADDTTLTLELEEGDSYTVNIANAYIVASDGIATGKEATVTYIGDLDDDAMAVKVVMEDSYDTEAAKRNAFVGKVVQSEEGNIVLESSNEDFYTFVSDDLDFTEYSAGETVRIFYTGTITDKEIQAEEIEKK